MKTVMKYATIAGVAIFAAGSAAWAQGYTPNAGTGSQGSYASNPSTQGYTSPGP